MAVDLAGVALQDGEGGCSLAVRVQPRADRDAIVGCHGAALKVRLTAPPVDGRANEALVALLAARLGLARSAVAVVGGERSRDKRLFLAGLSADEARRRLERGTA